MAFTTIDGVLGFVDLYLADTVGPGPVNYAATPNTYGRMNQPGLELRATDPNLGGATFVFAKAAANVAASQVCELTQAVTSGRFDVSAQPWVGAAATGKPLAVPLVALAAGQWGWFQVQGLAVVTCQGAPAAGGVAYWQAAGTVSPTAVASKAVLNAQFASAAATTIGTGSGAQVLAANQALLLLNRPCAQGPIT